MSNVLVTGANRGIGLGLVRAFLKDNKIEYLFATCRDPQGAQVDYILIFLFEAYRNLGTKESE